MNFHLLEIVSIQSFVTSYYHLKFEAVVGHVISDFEKNKTLINSEVIACCPVTLKVQIRCLFIDVMVNAIKCFVIRHVCFSC